MSATYWVLASDELMDSDPPWASVGLEPVEKGGYDSPGMRWWKFRDEGADPELNGQRIELIVARVDGEPVITDRRLMA